jgi:hypothetical protein
VAVAAGVEGSFVSIMGFILLATKS